MKYIFEEIIKTDEIFMIIEQHFEETTEKEYMKHLVKDTMHHKLLDLVLDELDEDRKIIFLAGADNESEHKGLLDKLKAWVDNFEDKLSHRAKEAEAEMVNLIKLD